MVAIFAGVRASWHKYAGLPLVELRPIVCLQYSLYAGCGGAERETNAVFIQLQVPGVFQGAEDNGQALS